MKTLFLFSILLAGFFVACSEDDDENLPVNPTPIELDLKSQQLVEADNAFGLDVFQRLNAEEDGNFMVSPLSISQALAMTYNGAEGETKTAMEDALKVGGLTPDEINQSYQTLVNALLKADNRVTLDIAQSIWYRENFHVEPGFISTNQNYYDAEVRELDFGRSDALDIINGWIETQTHDKIQDMIKRIDPNHVMFLINAIYFKGSWQSKFDVENTTQKPFYVDADKTINVDMMQKSDSVMYQQSELFAAIEMPYGRGNFNMVVLLPNSDKTIDDVAAELTAENWDNWMDSFYAVNDLNVQLPKFKAEYEVKLNDVLSAMGMEVAFTPGADFSGIDGSGDIWIDYVQHNTFIEVNEEGSEAAAATVVAMREYAAMPVSFNANRPFIYAITEKETGAILFIGKMIQPR
ncbi:MAG: serpin family protein [Prolixibacteraceae bacterium]|nr:serpin family protein [Prolixibacteraceae bacterium]MBN2649871.1 serpin family protein [Prolixibacteraceae bacterium]